MKVLNSIKERLTSALAILILMAAVVLCNARFPVALNIVIAMISVMAVWEITAALQMTRQIALMVPSMIFAAVLPFLTGLFAQGMGLFIYTVVLFSAMILYHSVITFREVAIIYSMSLLIPTALQTLVLLRDFGGSHGMFHVIVAIFSAWVADAGAYIFGSLFGKHKLCPNISPKKTVEGAIGGIVADILIMLLFGLIFQDFYWNKTVHVNFFVLAAIGLFGALLSMLGDLSFSIIKRSCHIKDFSELIPGHGGILDRFDSVIFVAPFVCLFLRIFPMVYA